MIPISSSIVAAVVLSEIDGVMKMLLMKRMKGGYWCHIAGSIEGDETGWQAIVRELKEETYIDINTADLYNAQYLQQFFEANLNMLQIIPVFVVICPPNQAVVLNHEHTDYQWCTLEEAKALTPFPNQHRVFDHVWAYFVDKPIEPLFKVDVK